VLGAELGKYTVDNSAPETPRVDQYADGVRDELCVIVGNCYEVRGPFISYRAAEEWIAEHEHRGYSHDITRLWPVR
jgi:hypothetical protein